MDEDEGAATAAKAFALNNNATPNPAPVTTE